MSFIPAVGSPVQAWVDAWSRFLSPYDLNPLNINPLKELIERFVDFEAIRKCEDLRLFVSATNVHTGQLRVFSRREITADAVMASAALPYVFRAVEIDGVPYWDGGYTANPPIFPLLRGKYSPDVLVVQINPLMRRATPTSSKDILHRINEITFNSSLAAEMRVIEFISQLLDRGELTSPSGEYRPIHMHRIVLGEHKPLELGSRLNNDFDFFETVASRRQARRTALPRRALRRHRRARHRSSTMASGVKARMRANAIAAHRRAGARLEIVVADITTLDSSDRQRRNRSAGRRRGRRRDPSRGRTGVLRMRRSAAATGSAKITRLPLKQACHPRRRPGVDGGAKEPDCWHPAIARLSRRRMAALHRIPGDFTGVYRFRPISRRASRSARGVGVSAAAASARGVLLLSRNRRASCMRSPTWTG